MATRCTDLSSKASVSGASLSFQLQTCPNPSYENGVLWPLSCEFFVGIHSPRLGKVALNKAMAGKLNVAPKGTLVKFRARKTMNNSLQRKRVYYEATEVDVFAGKLDQMSGIEVIHGHISRLEDGYGWVAEKMRHGGGRFVHFQYWSLSPIHHCLPYDDAGMKLREAQVKCYYLRGNRGPEALRVEILHYGSEWLKRFGEEADIGHELSADVVHLPKEMGVIEDCYATCEAFIRFRNGQRAELKLVDVCNCPVNDIRMIKGFRVQFDAIRLESKSPGQYPRGDEQMQAQFMARNVLVENPPSRIEINAMNEKSEEAKRKIVGFGEPAGPDGSCGGYLGAYLAERIAPIPKIPEIFRESQMDFSAAQSVGSRRSPDFAVSNSRRDAGMMNSPGAPAPPVAIGATAGFRSFAASSASFSLPIANSFPESEISASETTNRIGVANRLVDEGRQLTGSLMVRGPNSVVPRLQTDSPTLLYLVMHDF